MRFIFSWVDCSLKDFICCFPLRNLQWTCHLTLKPEGEFLSSLTLFLWICLMHPKFMTCSRSRKSRMDAPLNTFFSSIWSNSICKASAFHLIFVGYLSCAAGHCWYLFIFFHVLVKMKRYLWCRIRVPLELCV